MFFFLQLAYWWYHSKTLVLKGNGPPSTNQHGTFLLGSHLVVCDKKRATLLSDAIHFQPKITDIFWGVVL